MDILNPVNAVSYLLKKRRTGCITSDPSQPQPVPLELGQSRAQTISQLAVARPHAKRLLVSSATQVRIAETAVAVTPKLLCRLWL
jgi:hypothetical protein